MKYFYVLLIFALVSCGSDENNEKRTIASSENAISFEGEYSDEFTQVMFTCDRFGLKSKIAAAYFNQRAKELNLNYRAVAKSLNMTASSGKLIPNKVINTYRKQGINIKSPAIVGLRTKDIDSVDQIYMLDAFDKYGDNENFVDWTDVESNFQMEDLGLENIKAKIDALIATY